MWKFNASRSTKHDHKWLDRKLRSRAWSNQLGLLSLQGNLFETVLREIFTFQRETLLETMLCGEVPAVWQGGYPVQRVTDHQGGGKHAFDATWWFKSLLANLPKYPDVLYQVSRHFLVVRLSLIIQHNLSKDCS